MSSAALKRECEKILARLKETANKQADSARKSLEKQTGQILIINRTRFSRNLGQLLPQISGSEGRALRDEIWQTFTTSLKGLERYLSEERKNELRAISIVGKRDNDYIFYVKNYRSAQRAKSQMLKAVIKRVLGNANVGYNEDDLRRVAGSDNKSGAQIGHAETLNGSQIGYAASTARGAMAKQMVEGSSLGMSDKAQLSTIITNFQNTIGFQIDHEQLLDKDGNFNKKYVPILSWQTALSNQDLSQLEQAAIKGLVDSLQDIANLESSTTLKNAVAQIALYNIGGKKRKNKKVTGTAKSKINEKSSAKSSKKTGSKKSTRVMRDSTVPSDIMGTRASATVPSLGYLIAIFNEQLPRTVAKNMGAPRLQNRTGRFAQSVRVSDIAITPQGYPSVGYTYQLNPYQTFEPGYRQGYKQGAPDRDPRKLIDVSIREIATQFAMGRFYTRRV